MFLSGTGNIQTRFPLIRVTFQVVTTMTKNVGSNSYTCPIRFEGPPELVSYHLFYSTACYLHGYNLGLSSILCPCLDITSQRNLPWPPSRIGSLYPVNLFHIVWLCFSSWQLLPVGMYLCLVISLPLSAVLEYTSKLPEGRTMSVLSQLYGECLACNRHPINIWWVQEWLSMWNETGSRKLGCCVLKVGSPA